MHNWLKIALGNILKNKHRSFVTILAISLGFASVSTFRGYVHNTYTGLRKAAIQGEGLGHLTIYKKGWQRNGKFDPDTYMFAREEIGIITKLLQGEEGVVLVTPRLHISGLVSNGLVSTIFLASGVVPDDEKIIQGDMLDSRPVTGERISEEKEYGVEMAMDLSSLLGLEPGNDAVVMASTPNGQMNALDIEVSGIYDTGTEATNDKYMRVPFLFAQSLYDTEKADRIVVLLDDWLKTENMGVTLQEKLEVAGFECEIETWNEISVFYTKVRGMFDMIFMFIFSIVLVVVTMSVVNTMGMAVLERTREIGTLRAMGVKRRGISLLFAMEGAMLGFIGSMVGVLLNLLVWAGIQAADFSYVPPGNSSSVPLVVDLLPFTLLQLTIFLVFLSLMAAIIPARRAARLNVVDALGHV